MSKYQKHDSYQMFFMTQRIFLKMTLKLTILSDFIPIFKWFDTFRNTSQKSSQNIKVALKLELWIESFFERFPKMIALFATRKRKWQPFLKGNCQRFLVLIESETWKWHPNKLFCGNKRSWGLTKRWGFEVYSLRIYHQ